MGELVYHGTTRSYHSDQLKRFGRYQHLPLKSLGSVMDNDRVHMARDPEAAMSFAVQRAQQYSDQPILLIVKQAIITPEARFVWKPRVSCDFLERGWYKVFDVKTFEGKANIGSLEGLRELENKVLML